MIKLVYFVYKIMLIKNDLKPIIAYNYTQIKHIEYEVECEIMFFTV